MLPGGPAGVADTSFEGIKSRGVVADVGEVANADASPVERTALCRKTPRCKDPLRERGILRDPLPPLFGSRADTAGCELIEERGGRSRSVALLIAGARVCGGIVRPGKRGAPPLRRMNGDGQSGSSADHFAGVPSGR